MIGLHVFLLFSLLVQAPKRPHISPWEPCLVCRPGWISLPVSQCSPLSSRATGKKKMGCIFFLLSLLLPFFSPIFQEGDDHVAECSYRHRYDILKGGGDIWIDIRLQFFNSAFRELTCDFLIYRYHTCNNFRLWPTTKKATKLSLEPYRLHWIMGIIYNIPPEERLFSS